MDVVAGLLLLVLLAAVYFLLTIIAGARGQVSDGAIFALNLLAGWTALGWIAAFVWSLTGDTRNNFLAVTISERADGVVHSAAAERQERALEPRVERYALAARWIPAAILGGLGMLWVIGSLVWETADNRQQVLRLSMRRRRA